MLDYIVQNFNLVSFVLALSFFLIVSAVSRIISNYIVMRKYQGQAKQAEAELAGFMQRLKHKLRASGDELKKRGFKNDENSAK